MHWVTALTLHITDVYSMIICWQLDEPLCNELALPVRHY